MPSSTAYRKAPSKNHHRHTRGRPQRIPDRLLEEARRTFPRDARDVTQRSLQNKVYAVWALDMLKGEEQYRWLCGDFTGRTTLSWMSFWPGEQHSWLPTILAALGRLGFPDRPAIVWALAAKICAVQPSTREALRLIHQWQGRKTSGTARGLARAISQAVERYLQRHPDTSPKVIHQALRLVRHRDSADA